MVLAGTQPVSASVEAPGASELQAGSERSARLRMLLVVNVLVIVLAGVAALVLLILAVERGL